MENPIQKLRQNPTVLEKSGILLEELRRLISPNYRRVEYFLLK